MSRITITRGADVFAFIDADTDEAKQFRTYLLYWRALEGLVTDRFGVDPLVLLHAEISKTRSFRSLGGRRFGGDADELRRLLINAWTSEMSLYLIELDDPGRLRIANHWAPVKAYYATGQAALAWIYVQTSSTPLSHRGMLKAISEQITTRESLYPEPWRLCCEAMHPSVAYGGFVTRPGACSNLSGVAPHPDRIAQCLRTTRKRNVERLVAEMRRKEKRDRARAGESARRDAALEATTIFDFLWRTRHRSNYGDPAMYYMGQLDPLDTSNYMRAVQRVTAATMFLFEALIAERARSVLDDAATHFISRDRSGISDRVLVPRLAELGLAAQPAARGA